MCLRLNIATGLTNSWYYTLQDERSERLASICEKAGARTCVSGPAAREYLDESDCARRGIAVEWFECGPCPKYPQP